MRLGLFFTVLFLGTMLVFYLSWLPMPRLSLLWFIPHWLGQWADADNNDRLRTGIPFIFLGLVVGAWLSAEEPPWYWWLLSLACLVAVVVIAELGQLLLPLRFFDWGDIVWGGAGASAGIGAAAAIGGYHKKSKAK